MINNKNFIILVLATKLVLSENEFISANNKISPKIYQEVAKTTTTNFLVSPFSLETIMALVQVGARGSTKQELLQGLKFLNYSFVIESSIKTTLPLFKSGDSYTLSTANKIYLKENFTVKTSFKDAVTNVFGDVFENIDFNKAEAANQINEWVEEKTNNKIQNLVEPSILNNKTRSILVNAVYFKANWAIPFHLVFTGHTDFHRASDEIVSVTMMYGQKLARYNYYAYPEIKAQFVELPFHGEEASMIFVLPDELYGLSDLEKNMDKVFEPHPFKNELVRLGLPRFKILEEIDLVPILENLGIHLLFDAKQADLSGIAGIKGDLVVNQVLQKTFIDVNEAGVEAAAATFNVPALTLQDQKRFIADHPFIFYIKVKDAILFVGRVNDPSK